MKKIQFTLLLCFGLYTSLISQEKLRWINKDLRAAQQIAEIENKLVFVDTYTNSCTPCKVMDIELLNSKLISYFNKNFINVKVDMNSDFGKSIKAKYELVFLPTLMILDTDGNIRYKVDEVIPAKELLYKSRLVREQNMSLSDASEINFTPVTRTVKKTSKNLPAVSDMKIEDVQPEDITSEEKILFVLDGNNGEVPPFVLKQEAYHRLTLGDNSHIKAAKEYLDSQTDWSTTENIRFIFDFLGDTRDTLFQYTLEHRIQFNEVVSKNQVDRALKILIDNRLQRGFPRPDLSECKYLFSVSHPTDYEKLAYLYRLDILKLDESYQEYIDLAQVYIQTINSADHRVMANTGEFYILNDQKNKDQLDQQISWVNTAIKLSNNNPLYYKTLAHLYFLDGNKALAIKSLSLARNFAIKKGIVLKADKSLERKINAL